MPSLTIKISGTQGVDNHTVSLTECDDKGDCIINYNFNVDSNDPFTKKDGIAEDFYRRIEAFLYKNNVSILKLSSLMDTKDIANRLLAEFAVKLNGILNEKL